MAQKLNFLKKLISARLVTASTAAFITAASSTAMGAAQPTTRTANIDTADFNERNHWEPNGPVVDGDNLKFAEGFNNMTSAENTVTFDNNNVEDTRVTVGNFQLDVAGAVGDDRQLTLQATDKATINLGTKNGINYYVQENIGKYSGLLAIDFNNQEATAKITTKDFNWNVNFLSSDGKNGTLIIDATGVILGGTFADGDQSIANLVVNDGGDVTINSNLIIDTVITLNGDAGKAGGTLNIGASKNVVTANINGANAETGTLKLLGNNKIRADIGNGNALNAVYIDGLVQFEGGGQKVVKATNIHLNGANAIMKFITNNQTVTGNIVAESNGEGSIAINGVDVTITGNVGADGASLGTINFETGNTLKLIVPDANNNNLHVKNIITTIANKGTLELHGNYNIFSNIGDETNALALVNIVDNGNDGAPDDATVTLKQGNSINAQQVKIADNARNNTLQLEPGTKITGNIITDKVGNGILTLIKGADGNAGTAVINGNIGAGKAIKSVNLNGNDLTFGGKNILIDNAVDNGIKFTANETLTLTKNDNIAINSNIIVGTDKQGIIDASALASGKTLTFQNAIGAAGKSLGLLNIGASTASLKGDAFINTLAIGDGGSIQLGQHNYLIANTQNTDGQGKLIVRAGDGNNATLLENTNIGSEYNLFAEINFADNSTLVVGKNVKLYANKITTDNANNGSLNFNGGGTNLVFGTAGVNKALSNVTVSNGATVTFMDTANFGGDTFIDNKSILVIRANYTANTIAGAAPNNGTLQFSNPEPITVTLNTQVAAVDALAEINVQGNDVKFEIGANNGANTGINITTINFKSDAKLYLPEGVPLDNLTMNSTVVANNVFDSPVVIITNADSTIAAGKIIGDRNNIVGLGLATDNGITVQLPTLYAAIGTTKDNQGTVTLSGGLGNTAGEVYGLGLKGQKLKSVIVTTNYQNFGNTAAVNLVVNDGLTYQTGGSFGLDFDGTITLGNDNGNSTVVFADGIKSTATSTVATAKANNGIATYLGDANVGNIGSANAALATTKFTGKNNNTATLLGNIYSKAIDFGTTNLFVNTDNAILSGNTIAINNNINVQNNVLTFESGTTTLGANTSVSTTLDAAEGNLGKIEIADGATVNAQNVIALNINVVNDNATNVTTTQDYTFVEGGKNFKGSFVTPNITGGNRFLAYSVIRDKNQDYILTRSIDVRNVLQKDIANSQYRDVPGINGNVNVFINSDTAANKNLLLAKDSVDSSNFVGSLTTDTGAVVQEDLLNTAKVQQAQLTNRLDSLRHLGSYESAEGSAVPRAAGDEPVDNVAYGAWFKPFYAEAHQKAKGGVAGYKSKTTGGIIGLDTLANDNLMIGAAFGVTKTDIKHQDYKKGDKTEVTGSSFSLYAAQQLVNNFFAQGSAIFNLNHVKNKSQRYFFSDNGNANKQIASGNYDNMTFGGKLMVGYDASIMEGLLLTPVAGLSYLKSSDESYKETGTTVANKQVNSKFGDRTDLIIGTKLMGGAMNIMDYALYPEAHAFVTHKLNGKLAKGQSYLDGQTQPFISTPDKTVKTSYNLGLSVTARPGPKMEYGIGYDLDLASKYIAHQGTLKVRVNF